MWATVGGAEEPRLIRRLVVMFAEKGKCLSGDHDVLNQALGDFRDACAFGAGVGRKEVERLGLMPEPVSEVTVGPVLEALHLVSASKVHLAYEARSIPVVSKMTRPGNVLRKNHPMVAPGGTPVGFFARQHTHARWSAHGRSTDGRVEPDGTPRQDIKVLSTHNGIARETGDLRRVLVRHDKKDVRLLGHSADATSLSSRVRICAFGRHFRW